MSTQALSPGIAEAPRHSEAFNETSGIGRLWDPAKNIANWTVGRDASYVWQVWRTALPLWLADIASVAMTVGFAAVVLQMTGGVSAMFIAGLFASCCLMLSGGFILGGLYPATGMNSATELRLIVRVVSAGVTLCMAYDLAHGGSNSYLFLWPLCGGLLLVLLPFVRAFTRRAVCRSKWWGLQTIVIGAGDRGLDIVNRMRQNPALGLKPVALVDRFRPDWMLDHEGMPFGQICPLEDTPGLSNRLNAYCGVFIGSEFPEAGRMTMIDTLTSVFPQLYVTSDAADVGRNWSGVLQMGNLRLLRITEHLLMPGARWIKRMIDVMAVLAVSPILIPLVSTLAIAVKLTSAGPAFYAHSRIGRNGRTIRVWKLRSMVPNADRLLMDYLAKHPHLREDWERLHKLPNDPRVTFIGRILRKTSLDEIPQLWNVFRGDMSLVGPRPIVQAEIQKYQAVYPLYLRVTPGITGLWQVNGRNSTTYQERISYDAEYIRNWSICLDLYILARTVQTVITCDGAC
ncbi:undecaprenyl-phosphate galactose phosphotransferase WbaP [Schlesneria paludicola]|uniref:undecaprenyl-phosphate galactose phosphotransferase WbaP n=1 Tax=Schlesneria paludicola TaxID=360056 RepID=UPI0012FA9DFD|nr:undecaprenyl-phosphate galactose phosphotransferase WbaP [Schlesneria paludicola]